METAIYRGGAPKKDDDKRRTVYVQVRCTEGEKQQFFDRMALTSERDLSSFIRAICLGKPLTMRVQLTTHQQTVLSILREYRDDVLRIGVNVNQATRRINSTTDYHDLRREIDSMAANLGQLTQQIDALLTTVSGAGVPDSPQ